MRFNPEISHTAVRHVTNKTTVTCNCHDILTDSVGECAELKRV